MKNSELLKKIIQSFLLVVKKKTSQDFTLKSMNYILEKHRTDYKFLESISAEISPVNQEISIAVEENISLKYANRDKIAEFLEIVFKEIFKEILQDEFFYNTDLQEIAINVIDDTGFLLDKLGIKIRWNQVIQGATGETKSGKIKNIDKELTKKSDVLKPLVNSLVDLLYKGMIKKEKRRTDAVTLIVNTLRELEKKHEIFKYMLLEDIDKEKIDYGIKTQWKIDDILFFNSKDEYAVKAVSKIDRINNEEYKEAIKEFIIIIGGYINVKDRPFYIQRLKELMDDDCLKKFIDIGIDFDEIEETFKKLGYNDVIKKTFEAIIEIIASKTSKSYALVALDTIFEKLQVKECDEILQYINIDKSQIEKGAEAITIDFDINKKDPYKISKTIKLVLKETQENQKNYAEKASFFNDLKREMGERYYAELQKMGVNVNLLSMRYV